MLAKEFIVKEIPVLNPIDTGLKAQNLMNKHKLRHLPIVEEGKYVALVSDEEITQLPGTNNSIAGIASIAPKVLAGKIWLDAVQVANTYKLSLVPVVDEGNQYIGSITLDKLINRFSDLLNLTGEGSLIIMEVEMKSYLASEIAKIVEANDAELISLFYVPNEKNNTYAIYIKINLEDASAVIRGFERFGYNVLRIFARETVADDIIKERLDEFLHFLDL